MTTVDPLITQLAARRRELGLSQQTLAVLTDTVQSAISDIERGRGCPNLATVRRWARALDIDIALVPAVSPQSVGEVGADHNLREGFAPTPTACERCDGARQVGVWPCRECCCVICGQVTDTPPECGDCALAEDDRAKRRADV